MIDLLSKLWSVISHLGDWFLWALVSAVNLLIAAVGTLIAFVLGLLPSLPTPPTVPSGSWLAWLCWFMPVGSLVAGFGLMVTAWIAFLLIRIALKWAKAL